MGEFSDYRAARVGRRARLVGYTNETGIESAIIAGDYNEDGVVNAADFTVWRNTIGQQVAAGSSADGNRNGHIDDDDFEIWKDFFGRKVVGDSAIGFGGEPVRHSQVVPEPVGCLLLLAGLIAQAVFWRIRALSWPSLESPTLGRYTDSPACPMNRDSPASDR